AVPPRARPVPARRSNQISPAAERDGPLPERAADLVGGERGQLAGAIIAARLFDQFDVGVVLARVADELVRAGRQPPQDLEDPDLVQAARLDVAPALRPVAARAELAAREPGQPRQQTRLQAAAGLGDPGQGGALDG